MKTAKITLDVGQTHVTKFGVTPAEAQFLVAMFHRVAKGNPIKTLEETEDVERTNIQEMSRLRAKYPNKKLEKMYGSANPNLPEDFDEALQVGTSTQLGRSTFLASAGPVEKGDE